jgi:hypothetical protein
MCQLRSKKKLEHKLLDAENRLVGNDLAPGYQALPEPFWRDNCEKRNQLPTTYLYPII